GVDPSYRVIPPLHFIAAVIWGFSAAAWTLNAYTNSGLRLTPSIQLTVGSVAWIKALHHTVSFLFWYSCFYTRICSLWLSFGVYITGIVFRTTTLVSFTLVFFVTNPRRISLPDDRREIAGLACFYYYSLVGYTASVPYFTILMAFNYVMTLYVVHSHASKTLILLRNHHKIFSPVNGNDDHDRVFFFFCFAFTRKFRTAIHVVIALELAAMMRLEGGLERYWMRFMVRECTLFFSFIYLG
ncbi:hypothetical protein M569_15302, partial [Genlisea aurea]